jgi:PAS domain S-box-containing protein/excisionase family DNA binding protein
MDSAQDPALLERGVPASAADGRAYYSISQAAALLGVSRVTIWRWIRANRLPVYRLGHRTARIKREDLERLLVQGGPAGTQSWGAEDAGAGDAVGDDARSAPPADWSELSASEHIVQFYESDAFLLDAVGEFIGMALRAGAAGIVLATPAHRAGIEERFQAAGLDVAAARASGQYMSLDAAETLARVMVDGAPAPDRFAEVMGDVLARVDVNRRPVRIFGELVALLVADGKHAAAVRLEELWNDLQREHAFSLMCGYPMDGFGEEALTEQLGEVCAEHSHVIPAESYTALADPDDRLRVIAELQQKAASLEAEVAERRQVEEQLQAALASEGRKEQELRDFVETAPLGMHWVGPDGTILWANQAELELLGYSPEEYIGRHIAEFHADQDVIDDILARLGRGETLRQYPARLRCKDGSVKHVLIDSSVLWEEGRFVHTCCFTRDVTKLRSAEEERARLLERERAAGYEAQRAAERARRLQEITVQLSQSLEADQVLATIARSAADLLQVAVGAVFLLDRDEPNGDFILAAAYGIDEARALDLRLPRRASLAGRAVDEGRTLVVDDVRGTPGTALPALLTGQMAGSEIAAPITAGSARLGVVKAFSPTVQRFGPDDAELLTALAAAAAVALTNAHLYRQTQAAVQMRDEFLGIVSHDLKTPITGLLGYAQLLRRELDRADGPRSDRLGQGLAQMEVTTRKMAAMIDELLDVTRLELGQPLALERALTDLVALAEQVAAEHRPAAPQHTIRVEAAVPRLLGWWDAGRLERVLDNLLSNAIKYSPNGGEIVVEVTRVEEATGEWAVVTVRDDGIGIPAADLPRIFERFHRGANVAGRIGGVGLGLAGVRQVVEQHGGTVTVDSREGEGSTFTVRLPLTPPEAANLDRDEDNCS